MTSDNASRGILAAAAAFSLWGLFPLYWNLVGDVPPLQVLAHRGLWCAVAVGAVLVVQRDLTWIRSLPLRELGLLAVGGLLLTANWGVYVWAVMNGHVVDTSLGYYITPLINVLLAVLVFRETLTRMQRVAVFVAATGVTLLGVGLGHPPWIALALALSFGLYGLVRKLVVIDAMRGLAVESSLMVPPALAYLIWCEQVGQGHFLHGATRSDILMVLGGPVTAVPLALFAWGARRIPMLALGVMQYIAPTIQLLLGVLLFHEPFGGGRALAFGLIWVALALFTGEALWRYRAASK